MLARVGDLLLAAHLPRAHGRDHLQLGGERGDGRLNAHLIVALAGATVGDRVAAGATRVVNRELGDQRTSERGEQRVAASVERVGLDRRGHIAARELLARIHHVTVERAEHTGLSLDDPVVLARLTEVHGEADHLRFVLVLYPLEHDARVETARIQKQHTTHLLGVGLIRSGSWREAGCGSAHGGEG